MDILSLSICIGKGALHLLTFFYTKIKYISNFSTFNFFQFVTANSKIFEIFIIQNLFVNCYIFFSMEIDNIFSCFADSLEFVAEFGKCSTTCKGNIGIFTKPYPIKYSGI